MKLKLKSGVSPVKLVAVLVVLAVAWPFRAAIAEKTKPVVNIGKIVRTWQEMRMYRTALIGYMNRNGGDVPRDLHGWLDRRYDRGARPASRDVFGTPYRLGMDFRTPVLRSCGIDQRCNTDDDITVRIERAD